MVGPGNFEMDAGLLKNFPITQRFDLALKAEFFNLPNHTNLGNPGNTYLQPSSFGKIQSAGPPRVIQLSGRLTF